MLTHLCNFLRVHKVLITCLSIGLAAVSSGFSAPFYSSALVQLGGSQIIGANSWEYFSNMLTSATTNGPQFRPISFFMYFYFMRSNFGLDPFWYHISGTGMFIILIGVCFNFFQKITQDKLAGFVAACFLALHPVTFCMFSEIDMNFKYFVPLIYLAAGLNMIFDNPQLTPKKILFLFFCEIIMILSHEAAIVFPLIFGFFYWSLKKPLPKFLLFLFIPSITYWFTRVFYFGLPSSGFMSLSWTQLPKSLSFYFEKLVLPLNSMFENEYSFLGITLFTFSLCIALFQLKSGQRIFLFCILSTTVLLTPYALLKNHIFFTRSFWGLLPFALALGIGISIFNEKTKNAQFFRKYFGRLYLPTIGCFFVILFALARHSTVDKRIKWYKDIETSQREIVTLVSKRLEGVSPDQAVELRVPKFKVWKVNDWEIYGFIGLMFPQYQFIDFEIAKRSKDYDLAVIYRGTFYRRRKRLEEFAITQNTFSAFYWRNNNPQWIDQYFKKAPPIPLGETVKVIDLTELSDFTLSNFH